MIQTGIVREAENASVELSVKKLSTSEQKPRMKKALGDVQNTLHSRCNFVNGNFGSEIKLASKPLIYSKSDTNGKVLSGKSITASGRKMNVTPTKSTREIFVSTPTLSNEISEIHNHILCEQDHQFYVNDFLNEYKISEEQINRLAHSVKSFVTPISLGVFEPCEDIKIPNSKIFNEDSFTVNDIHNDVIIPPVPAPIEML